LDSAACLRLAARVQELGVQDLGFQRQERASFFVVHRAPLQIRGDVVVVGVVVVGTGTLEHPDRLRSGSRRGGHGGRHA